MKVGGLVAGVLMLVGCANGEGDPYVFRFEGTEEDRAAFMSAVAEWNHVCGEIITVVQAGGAPVYPGLRTDAPYPRYSGLTSNVDGRVVEIQYIPGLSRLHVVFAHELGHAIRGNNDHDSTGLMMPVLSLKNYAVTPDLCP